ncbi:E3 ubiquitin-protein ligase Iruka [Folsomia candida]|uniref:RING-type E3 ubiquitin transferase n=1 Tax=Folsomia candida TaxID=158441 RepID=A0A226EJA2_FOLCA|nr:E3 ubiquitin-protein ligase Iruka [Folsomia candida]OXA56626.1 hypothetical protein Fcan01_09347 [Folsomia candida]
MASAATDSVPHSKFFCYKCNEEIPRVLDDFTCPICKGGFIEEVQESQNAGSGPGSDSASDATFDVGGGFDFLQLLRGLSEPSGGGGGGGTSVRFQTGSNPATFQRTRSEGAPSPGTNNPGFSFVLGPTQGRGGGTGRSNPNLDNPMEHVLFTFLNDLIHGLGGGAAVGGAGVPLLSNVGDYAWGRDGLDAVVTQLMNQMEGTGPPPLATDRIDTLPDVTINQDQVDRKLQCSVCWDDFGVGEVVKKLECEHVYHPDCIIPWLKLHGTCPICRKDLTGQVREGETVHETPSTRFEPMAVDDETSSNLHSNECPIAAHRTPATASAPSSARNYSSSNATSSPMSNPVVQSLNQILNPLLSGLAGRTSNNTSNSTPPPPGPHASSQPSTQPQQQPGDRRGPGGQGFDNMDLEFD